MTASFADFCKMRSKIRNFVLNLHGYIIFTMIVSFVIL